MFTTEEILNALSTAKESIENLKNDNVQNALLFINEQNKIDDIVANFQSKNFAILLGLLDEQSKANFSTILSTKKAEYEADQDKQDSVKMLLAGDAKMLVHGIFSIYSHNLFEIVYKEGSETTAKIAEIDAIIEEAQKLEFIDEEQLVDIKEYHSKVIESRGFLSDSMWVFKTKFEAVEHEFNNLTQDDFGLIAESFLDNAHME